MFTVTFNGFKTKQQAVCFAQWYQNSGEQDASEFMDMWAGVDSCNTRTLTETSEGASVDLEIIEVQASRIRW